MVTFPSLTVWVGGVRPVGGPIRSGEVQPKEDVVIIGVGIDVVPVARFAESLERTPGLADRLFTPAERRTHLGIPRTAESLAGRFAAKEALAKALGAPAGMLWIDAEVIVEDTGQPRLQVTGTVAARAAVLGVRSWHVSLSHDGGIASAVVVAEGSVEGVS
jgi:holo-[acyl-carrier protein] synthase